MSKFKISKIFAREIIDCRGWPTVQADVWIDGQLKGRADVASGRSTGAHEAHELRDKDPNRYKGLGVLNAVDNVNNEINPALIGMDVTQQRKIDLTMKELDGTPTKSRLGANAILSVSLAAARAGASVCGVPLYRYLNPNSHIIPVPLMNFINGGKLTANDLEIQEFIIMPVGADSYKNALQITTEINEALRDLVVEKYGILATNTGDEGGFATPMHGIWEPFEFLSTAVKLAGYKEIEDVVYAMDLASNSWFNKEENVYELDGKRYEPDALIELYKQVANKYPIASMEDPLQEEDFEGFSKLTTELDIQIVGDDLFVTNIERLKMGIKQGAANAMLFKVNQIGTLSEALDAAEFAYRSDYAVQVSERSGETEDPIISDLVVALNSGQIKTGMPVRGERTSKHNRLIQIEEELGEAGAYAGKKFKRPA
jgi:enolase